MLYYYSRKFCYKLKLTQYKYIIITCNTLIHKVNIYVIINVKQYYT